MKYIFSTAFTFAAFLVAAQSTLFKIEGNGLTKPSYLFGTIHMICESDYVMKDEVPIVLDDVKTIYLEMDITDTAMMQGMMTKMIDPSMEEYYISMNNDARENLDQALQNALNIGFDQVKIMKPFMLSVLLIQSTIQCNKVLSLEDMLVDLAIEKNIPIKAFETLEFQLSIFDSIPIAEQILMLEDMALSLDAGKALFEKMVKAYVSGDIDELLALTQDDESLGQFDELLLDKRNENWLKMIPGIVKKSPTFIAVGAAHLPGEKGLLRGLKDMGYVITPM